MVERPLTPCPEQGCRVLTRGGRCDEHRREQGRDASRRAVERSGSRYYDTAEWRGIRLRHLAREPKCAACALEGRVTLAVQVDHVIPLSEGGSRKASNLQSLCASHHSRKTNADQRRRRAAEGDRD